MVLNHLSNSPKPGIPTVRRYKFNIIIVINFYFYFVSWKIFIWRSGNEIKNVNFWNECFQSIHFNCLVVQTQRNLDLLLYFGFIEWTTKRKWNTIPNVSTSDVQTPSTASGEWDGGKAKNEPSIELGSGVVDGRGMNWTYYSNTVPEIHTWWIVCQAQVWYSYGIKI